MPFRRRAAVLMALILALYGMLHAWCLPAMALPGGLVAVCTAHGVQWVPADGPEAPAKQKRDCPACQAGHCGVDLASPGLADTPEPPATFGTPGLPGHQHLGGLPSRLFPPARGPPAFG